MGLMTMNAVLKKHNISVPLKDLYFTDKYGNVIRHQDHAIHVAQNEDNQQNKTEAEKNPSQNEKIVTEVIDPIYDASNQDHAIHVAQNEDNQQNKTEVKKNPSQNEEIVTEVKKNLSQNEKIMATGGASNQDQHNGQDQQNENKVALDNGNLIKVIDLMYQVVRFDKIYQKAVSVIAHESDINDIEPVIKDINALLDDTSGLEGIWDKKESNLINNSGRSAPSTAIHAGVKTMNLHKGSLTKLIAGRKLAIDSFDAIKYFFNKTLNDFTAMSHCDNKSRVDSINICIVQPLNCKLKELLSATNDNNANVIDQFCVNYVNDDGTNNTNAYKSFCNNEESFAKEALETLDTLDTLDTQTCVGL